MRLHLRASALALGVFALSVFGSAQSSRLASSQRWTRTYGSGSPGERVFDLGLSPAGDLRVAGRGGTFGPGAAGGWLLSLSLADGGVELDRLVGRPGIGGVDGAALAADGGALFTGRDVIDLFHQHDAWVVRVDADGDVAWSQGFTGGGIGRHFLMDAAELPDGSWIAAGAKSLIDEPPQGAWLVKLARDGGVDWQFEYRGGVAEWLASVAVTSDGGFVVAGSTNSSGAGFDDALVMKLDATGAVEWQRTFGGADSDQATEVVELEGGGYGVAAWTNGATDSGHAPWVLRLDANGQLLWHKVIGSGEWGDLDGIAQSADGELVALGRVGQAGFPTNDLWAAKLAAADGAVLWQRAYEGSSGDWGSQVLALAGGGLVLAGEWGSGFPEEDVWLTRTDAHGRLGCDRERKTAFVASSPSVLAQAAVTVRLSGGALLQPAAFTDGASAAGSVDRCAND